jgi:hypothetical protein
MQYRNHQPTDILGGRAPVGGVGHPHHPLIQGRLLVTFVPVTRLVIRLLLTLTPLHGPLGSSHSPPPFG